MVRGSRLCDLANSMALSSVLSLSASLKRLNVCALPVRFCLVTRAGMFAGGMSCLAGEEDEVSAESCMTGSGCLLVHGWGEGCGSGCLLVHGRGEV